MVVSNYITGVCFIAPVSLPRLSLPLWCRNGCHLGKSCSSFCDIWGMFSPKKTLIRYMIRNILNVFKSEEY